MVDCDVIIVEGDITVLMSMMWFREVWLWLREMWLCLGFV